jgi:dynein intermediate chain 2, axonemal
VRSLGAVCGREVESLFDVLSSAEFEDEYITRGPSIAELDTTPMMSEHACNTERTVHKSTGMRHSMGGWPDNIDSTDTDQVSRFLKKCTKVCRPFHVRGVE